MAVEISLIRKASKENLCSKYVVGCEEHLPFRSNIFDGAVSCLNGHWINQLDGAKDLYFTY